MEASVAGEGWGLRSGGEVAVGRRGARDPGFCAKGPRWRMWSKSRTSNHSRCGEGFLWPLSHR